MCDPEATSPVPRSAASDATGRSRGRYAFDVVETVTGTNRATIHLLGELDVATADQLIEALDRQLAAGRRFINLDVSRLQFVDCAGLDALLAARNRLVAAHGTLVLTGAAPQTLRLLSLTHLENALIVTDEPRLSVRRLTRRRLRRDRGR